MTKDGMDSEDDLFGAAVIQGWDRMYIMAIASLLFVFYYVLLVFLYFFVREMFSF